ncbi:TIGR04388 family protein [Leptospira fletcheri]|uniref:TIGR04388 family protein n=1 Tax=Leptospira fletcheri TaxID=2484981 RepID=A0A4R9G487_9LEPT|nr:TIGR04388 family protein [Leptospira fletcheri]TGK06322.1 TIGR04388 family protein [Leptospira fletcheri]
MFHSSFCVRVCLFLFCVFSPLYGQPANVPSLNPQSYDWSQWQKNLQGSYSVANNQHSVAGWDGLVLQGFGVLQAEWEAQVQAEINAKVSSIHTQDSFQSVQDYQNYVYNFLEGQASSLLTQWQADAEVSIQLNREHFLSSNFGAGEAQLASMDRSFSQEFQDFLSGKSLSIGSDPLSNPFLSSSQNSLQQLEQNWFSQFQANVQNGLLNYQQALQSLNQNYANLLNQVNATEAKYQAYMQQILSYESSVKDQVKQTMDGYQQFLNGTDLFWNTANVLFDSKAGSYVSSPACPSGDICADYLYDVTSRQFSSSCASGDVCISLRYDTSTQQYLSAVCPSGGDCSSNPSQNFSVRTSLNADGKAFQNVINNIETAITQGLTSYGIFDATSGQLLSYPQSCVNVGSVCSSGQFDFTSSKFLSGSSCPAGHSCASAVVDLSDPSAPTGLYVASSCASGDPNCVVCPSTNGVADSCQVQSFEASLVYASNAMSSFFAREQGIFNTQLNSVLYGGNGIGGSQSLGLGFDPFNHSIKPSHSSSSLYITTWDFLSAQGRPDRRTGLVGLAWEIVDFLSGKISGTDFQNWLMNEYSAGSSGVCPSNPTITDNTYNSNDFNDACVAQAISGIAPGVIVDAVSSQGTDLVAFNDRSYVGNSYMITEGGPNNWNMDPAYCHDWLGCFFDPAGKVPAIGGANQFFQNNPTIGSPYGNNFYNYTEDQAGVTDWGPVLSNTTMQEDSIGIFLNYHTSDLNGRGNAVTWQAALNQLNQFATNWQNNVAPAILNWSAQVSNFQFQYSTWQQSEARLLSQAQSQYSSSLINLQKSEMSWLSQMNDLQTKVNGEFAAANSKLQNSQGQADANLVARELFARFNPGSSGAELSSIPKGSGSSDPFASMGSALDGIDPSKGLPNFDLLSKFSGAFGSAATGMGNLSLLSSTNNAIVNARASYMQDLASSLRSERTFTQNGEADLLKDHGKLSTKEVDGHTYLTDERGYFVSCSGGSCSSCGVDPTKCNGGSATELGAFIQSVCGEKMDSCNQYTRFKYSNVSYDKSTDSISMDESVYTGSASASSPGCNGNATDAGSYCFGTASRHVTINAPVFALGGGANSFGSLFDANPDHHEGDILSSFISRSFASMNNFFVNSSYSGAILSKLNALETANNYNLQAAGNSASAQAQNANLIADVIDIMVLHKGSVQDFIKKETQNLVNGMVATALANAFHLTPDEAAFAAGVYMDQQAYKNAEHHLGFLNKVDSFLKAIPILGNAILDPAYRQVLDLTHADDLRAIQQWKEDKYATYGFIATEILKSQNATPEQIAYVSRAVASFFRMKDAKEELGMRGNLLSMSRLDGMYRALTASVGGLGAEGLGAFLKFSGHALRSEGLISAREERKFDQDLRYAIDDMKMVYDKNAIKQWQGAQVQLIREATVAYGMNQGMDPQAVQTIANAVAEMVGRQQAQADLNKLHANEDLFTLGGTYLDRQAFKGGLSIMMTKIFRGALLSMVDTGRLTGLFTKSQTKEFYQQTLALSNSFTGATLEAQAHQGSLDKYWWKQQERNAVFDFLSKVLDPNGNPAEQQGVAAALKYYFDQKESKKQARKQKLLDIEQGIELAAAIAFTVLTEGAGSETVAGTTTEIANEARMVEAGEDLATVAKGAETVGQTAKDVSWLRTVAFSKDLFEVGGNMLKLQLTNGQLIAGLVSTVGQTWIGDELGGTNGAVAGLVNGIISTVTMGSNLPMTGFVSWTPHQNKDILLGEDGQAGGWGGGFAFADEGANVGLSFTPGSGIDLNVNYNFKGANGEGLGFLGGSYNASSGNTSVSGGVDLFGKEKGDLHHGGLVASVSKDGTSSIGGYYNYGDGRLPPNLRGHGATLNYSNDGRLNLSGQFKGSTVASVNYNTATGKFEKLEGNINFQNDLNLAFIQEHAIENFQKGSKTVATTTGKLLAEMGLLSKSDLSVLLSSPEGVNKINDLFEEMKSKLDTEEKKKLFKQQLKLAGKRIGIRIEFEPSVTETWQKLTNRVLGDVLLAFGGANTGLSAVDTAENLFRTKTCFVAETGVWTPKGRRSIQSLKVGEEVYSLNEETGEIEIQKITETFIHDVMSIHKLKYENEGNLGATWNHPFGVLNAGQRSKDSGVSGDLWVKVEDLRAGDRSITRRSLQNAKLKRRLANIPVIAASIGDRSWVNEDLRSNWKEEVEGTLEIREIQEIRRPEKVYNLEVEKNHSYFVFVGDEPVVVHNYIVDEKEPILSRSEVEKAYSPKETELKWKEKVYKKTTLNGETVFVRDYEKPNVKEYVRITKDGLIEQRLVWKGDTLLGDFVNSMTSGEKVKYFNTKGQEVFLQPEKIVRDQGSQKLPFDPVDPKLANETINKVKEDYRKTLEAEFANNKKLKPEQIQDEINKKMEVINRIADRTFKNSFVDENGNSIRFGSDEYLKTLAEPEFNGQDGGAKHTGMEIPVKVIIDYLRAKYPDGKGFTPNLAPWNERITSAKESLSMMSKTLEVLKSNPDIPKDAKVAIEKDMTKRMKSKRSEISTLETIRRSRMENFQAEKNLIFGKNEKGEYKVTSERIGEQTKAAICRVDTNYMEGRVNGRFEASFGDYFLNKIEMGDILPGKQQTQGLVLDQAFLTGFEKTYPLNNRDKLDGVGFEEANRYTGDPMPMYEIKNLVLSLKPGEAMQVWADTDFNKGMYSTPGPNHYYEIGKNSKGELLYLNHTGEQMKYIDSKGKQKVLVFGQPIPPEAWPYLRIFRIYK